MFLAAVTESGVRCELCRVEYAVSSSHMPSATSVSGVEPWLFTICETKLLSAASSQSRNNKHKSRS